MSERTDAILILEDGTTFRGKSIGNPGKTIGELVFNTSMTGYQEIFTDPANYGQLIVMSTPHVGNYGTTPEDADSDRIQCNGVIVNTFSEVTSRDRAEMSLEEHFIKDDKIGISNVDTRAIVRHIRTNGSMNAIICTEEGVSAADLLAELQEAPKMKGLELASKVTSKNSYVAESTTGETLHKISLLDFGSKNGIIRRFNSMSCEVKVFPMASSLEDIMGYQPDGVVISAGPGDPTVMESSIELVKNIIEANKPVFGINLGHQLIALSQGAEIEKMAHGHRGANHPVINHRTGKAEITTQNHSFVVSRISAEDNDDIEITHSHLNDNTVAGIALNTYPVISVQFHPEGAVGSNDSLYLMDEFVELMKRNK